MVVVVKLYRKSENISEQLGNFLEKEGLGSNRYGSKTSIPVIPHCDKNIDKFRDISRNSIVIKLLSK